MDAGTEKQDAPAQPDSLGYQPERISDLQIKRHRCTPSARPDSRTLSTSRQAALPSETSAWERGHYCWIVNTANQ
jgi:hypothetical protein